MRDQAMTSSNLLRSPGPCRFGRARLLARKRIAGKNYECVYILAIAPQTRAQSECLRLPLPLIEYCSGNNLVSLKRVLEVDRSKGKAHLFLEHSGQSRFAQPL